MEIAVIRCQLEFLKLYDLAHSGGKWYFGILGEETEQILYLTGSHDLFGKLFL